MRKLLCLIPLLLPGPLSRLWYRTVLGYRIGRNARIGFSYIDAGYCDIGDDVRIGHFNVVRAVKSLTIGRGSHVSNFNTVTGTVYTEPGWDGVVTIGERCMIMSRHLLDAGGRLTIGDGTTLAGRDTQLWTHTLTLVDGEQRLVPKALAIGPGCYLGARCTVLFCDIPAGAFVGAGSVVTKSLSSPDGTVLIAGNPASIRKVYPARG
jgi:acetyltransferase-like isoleucine patch superfamily enzyme